MGKIAEETIRRVLELTDIVKLIGEYIPLKRAGTLYKGCCPFHHEKTPSFTVNPGRQNFKCFGCGEGGNALGFLMKHENLSFVDSVRRLADKSGVVVIEENYNPQQEKRRKLKKSLVEVHQLVARWYHTQLLTHPQAKAAKDYILGRGFSEELLAEWEMGWAPESSADFFAWAKKEGITGRQLVESGICFLREEGQVRSGIMPRFRQRLMFPIANDYGEYVAFSGRIIEKKENTGKYINSPETSIFRKGKVIFGLHKARSSMGKMKDALLCEGQLDVIACHSAGVKHAIAPLGTAFTAQHAQLLRRYTPQVTLCFDGDGAGIKASHKAFDVLAEEGIFVKLAPLPAGDDPDSFIKREGVEAFWAFLEKAEPFFSATIKRARAEGLLNRAESKTLFLQELADHVSAIPNALYQDSVMTEISYSLRVSAEEFKEEVAHYAQQRAQRQKWEAERENALTQEREAFGEESEEGSQESENVASDGTFFGQEEARVSLPLRPVVLDKPVAHLCELCLSYKEAQASVSERIEDVMMALPLLKGIPLLQKILSSRPQADSPAAIYAFMESLPAEQSLALKRLNWERPVLEDVQGAVEVLMGEISRLALRRERDALIAALGEEASPLEAKLALFARLEEINQLLKN